MKLCSCESTVSIFTQIFVLLFIAQIPKNAWAIRKGEQRIKKIGTAKRWQGNSSEEVKGMCYKMTLKYKYAIFSIMVF